MKLKSLLIKLAFRVPTAPHAHPSGLYRALYYVLDKHFLYTNSHRAILHRGILNIWHRGTLNIWHRGILNILHKAYLNMLHRGNILLHRAACEKTFHANFFFIPTFNWLQMISTAMMQGFQKCDQIWNCSMGSGWKNWTGRQTDKHDVNFNIDIWFLKS